MTRCDDIEARSMALTALPASDGERRSAEAHAADCARCATSLQEGARLLAMVGAEFEPSHAAEVFERVEQAVLAEWDAGPTFWSRLLAAAIPVGIFAAVCAAAPDLAADAMSWALAIGTAALAALLSLGAPMGGRRLLAPAFAASLGLAAAAALGGTVAGHGGGLACFAVELACALVPAALSVLGAGSWPLRSAGTSAVLAGAAALSAQAALHLSCPVRGALLHLAAFHLAGVVAAAAIAARLQLRAARS